MKYASLYAPISEQMKSQAYPDWERAVNEHIIRALTSRFASREISQEVGEKELDEDKKRGFRLCFKSQKVLNNILNKLN